MKMKNAVIALALMAASSFAHAAETTGFVVPTKTPITFKRVYVPEGFDDNDNVQFVGEGIFSSGCYRYADTKLTINHAEKTIRIEPQAFKYSGACIQVMLPFDHTVDVGLLEQGTYSVIQGEGLEPIARIVVKGATTNEPDENLYAPVSQALYQSRGGTNKVYLTGDFPSSCMKLVKVETHVTADAIILQPITEMGTTNCTEAKSSFETVVQLGPIKAGRYLLHVRSMNGKSINNLVDVP